jgi:hypothetical protein
MIGLCRTVQHNGGVQIYICRTDQEDGGNPI